MKFRGLCLFGVLFVWFAWLMTECFAQENYPAAVENIPRQMTLRPMTDDGGQASQKSPWSYASQNVLLDYSYVGGSRVKNGDKDLGNGLDEQVFKFDYQFGIPLSKELFLQLSAGYHRFDFGFTTGSLTPQNLQSVNMGLGLGYNVDEKWSVLASFSPQIQQVNDWEDSPYVNFIGALVATYKWNRDLTVVFGLTIVPDNTIDVPVLPLAGVRWAFADKWTLQVGVPQTSIKYALTDKLNLWSQASVDGGTFRTGDDYGDAAGRPDLNRRKVSYTEVRVGVGADYELYQGIVLTGEVGSAVYREFEFKDKDKLKTDPALLAELGLKFKF
jgi:hypothetical protein